MECGHCTLCCKLLSVPWMNSPQGSWCDLCNPHEGCSIYKTMDKRCKSFACAYIQMKKVPIELRPDNCGTIFEKITDTLMLGTAVTIEEFSDIMQKQIMAFASEGISTMMQQYNPFKWICFTTPGADKSAIIQALKDKAYDSSKLY